MYHAKRNGGDRIEVYKPAMRARKSDRLSIESDLRRALEREEITLLYQPIVRLEDRVSPVSRRWRAGTIRSSAGCRRTNSSTSPRKAGSSSSSGCSCWSAPRGN